MSVPAIETASAHHPAELALRTFVTKAIETDTEATTLFALASANRTRSANPYCHEVGVRWHQYKKRILESPCPGQIASSWRQS